MKPTGLTRNLTHYGDPDFALFLRRSYIRSAGLSDDALDKPIVGIINTFSELNPCHRGLAELVAAVKRGIWQAGGLPMEFPVISLGEIFLHPTSMYLRNLMSMDVEEMIRAQPLDSVVLVGGCDKTLPALLMGAASADVPAIALAAGPMLSGEMDGERIGACTDCRRLWMAFRRGEIDRETIDRAERQLAPTAGTCAVMGTASTMACITEALGMMLPGGAAIPAVYSERLRHAEETGKAAVALIDSGRTPARVLTAEAFENALRVLLAIGGSTNGVIHLTAIAGRVGIRLDLRQLNRVSDDTPLLVDLKPAGSGYMEDFYRAGGVPAVMRELGPMLRLNALTATGKTIGDVVGAAARAPEWQHVIRHIARPLQPGGSLIALFGSLAPEGALLKRSAANPELLERTGRAVVFTSLADLAERIDSPDLDVRADDFLVLQNAGLLGAPGMPEAGALPIPKNLAGVKDMVRISDARMSGTAFGTVVLHVSPEAAAGGPLALVRNGDLIELSAERCEINLLVRPAELEARRKQLLPPKLPVRGYERLFARSVQQAHLGADFDFLRHESLHHAEHTTS